MTGVDREHAVVRLLNDLETLRRSLRLYPSTHPALKPARMRIRERVEAVAEREDSGALSFGPGSVFWNGQQLALSANAPATRLITMLFHAGVAAVNLRFPEACDGLADLAALLADLRDPPGEADRARFFESARVLGGIELVAIDLSDVRLLPSEQEAVRAGARPVWAELARRLSRDGAFPMAGKVHEGELTPGMVLDLIEGTSKLDVLFDHLFMQLGDIVRSSPEDRRPVTLQEVREFFDELVFLLTPERRKLAVVAAVRYLPVIGGDDPWIAAELLLDAVEFMLVQEVAVPETVQRALHGLAAPPAETGPEVPEELAARARHLLARLPVGELDDVTVHVIPPVPLRVDWSGNAHSKELAAELAEERVRRSVLRLLEEVVALWPGESLARRATVRLAEELAAAIDIGDFDTAVRLAPLVGGSSEPEASQVAADSVVPAVVRAFKTFDRGHQPELIDILAALGEDALIPILRVLAEEDSLGVRKRLLEVVTRHGERAVPHILPWLDDSRWYVARNAAFLLRRIGAKGSAPALKARATGAHPKVLGEILKALVAMEDPDWFQLLIASLDSSDAETRTVAADVAGRIPHPDVVRALIERLRPRIGMGLREPFSLDLIRALGRLRDPAALGPLKEIVGLKQWRYPFSLDALRREAAAAITSLSGHAAHRQALAFAAGRDEELGTAVKSALERRSEPEGEE